VIVVESAAMPANAKRALIAVAASDPSSTPAAICKINFMVLQQLVLLRLL
jgi:hypothetical protein